MKTMKKAKAGKSFDLNKDGKTTFKDVLIGRGVLPKTAKKGGSVKKAANGTTTTKTTVKPSLLDVKSALPSAGELNKIAPAPKRPMNSPGKPMKPNPRPDDISPKERFSTSGVGVNLTAKNGKTMKKAQNGTVQTSQQRTQSNLNKIAMKNAGDSLMKSIPGKAKSGAKLKKQAATAIAMKKAGKAPKMKSGGKMKKCRYGCN